MFLDTRRTVDRLISTTPTPSSSLTITSSSSPHRPSFSTTSSPSPSPAAAHVPLPAPVSLARVATAFVVDGGGRPNLGAKIFASLWYLLILPDSTSRLNRQVHTKRLPWYSPSRLVGIALAAANVASMPASWALLVAGKRNASRLASLAVLANPPTLTISVILLQEVVSQMLRSSSNVVVSVGNLLFKPVHMLLSKLPTNRTTTTTTVEGDGATTTGTTSTTTTTPPTSADTDAGKIQKTGGSGKAKLNAGVTNGTTPNKSDGDTSATSAATVDAIAASVKPSP